MSSTRHAADGSPFRQERYCSSPAYQSGLYALEVSKRVSVLDNPADRELVWAVQRMSWDDRGLGGLAEQILALCPELVGTASMHRYGIKSRKRYNDKQGSQIRSELPDKLESQLLNDYVYHGGDWNDCDTFVELCKTAALKLAEDLRDVCLDPQRDLSLWYLPDLRRAIRSCLAAQLEAAPKRVVTELGRQIGEALEYCLETRRLALLNGAHFTGKGFGAKVWAGQRPGRAFVYDVPSSNDDIGFFSGLARSIGVSVESTPKAQKLRDRVERVLQHGDLMVIFNRAQWCWPQSNNRKSKPTRLAWILSALVEKGVPVALITTPEFFRSQLEVEKQIGWLRGQLMNPLDYVELPPVLERADLLAVTQNILPAADKASLKAIVDFSHGTGKGLAGIEAVVSRARYIANRAGRNDVLQTDVRGAIKCVIPAEKALQIALGISVPADQCSKVAQPLQPSGTRPVSGPETNLRMNTPRSQANRINDTATTVLAEG